MDLKEAREKRREDITPLVTAVDKMRFGHIDGHLAVELTIQESPALPSYQIATVVIKIGNHLVHFNRAQTEILGDIEKGQ